MNASLSDVAPLGRHDRMCVLTGAGISAGAGLPTFRDADGLWTIAPEMERAMHGEFVPDNIEQLWSVWGAMYLAAVHAGPTPAHRALAEIPATVITQNIDALHTLAGSTDVIELHGCAGRARCLNGRCGWHTIVQADNSVHAVDAIYRDGLPHCPRCGSLVRPAVVLFGEQLPADGLARAQRCAADCDLFLAVGTSGVVAPASWLAQIAHDAGAVTVNVALEPSDNPAFDVEILRDAQIELPAWISDQAD